MSSPRNIQSPSPSEERRKSIAKLTRSPLSSSPLISNSPSRYGSRTNSFSSTSNGRFLKTKPSGVSANQDVFSKSDEDEDSNDSNSDLVSTLQDPAVIQNAARYLSPKPDPIKSEGGDITRDIYKSIEHNSGNNSAYNVSNNDHIQASSPRPASIRRARSYSSMEELQSHSRRGSTASSLNVPGGFRRDFLIHHGNKFQTKETNFLTRNFVEFLSIYGHFAGEDLEDEDDLIACHYKPFVAKTDEESSLLLSSSRDRDINPNGTATEKKAYFLLLKAFVGTGVLFLPKAFANGGLLFSALTLFFFGILSYWCYLILVYSKSATKVSSFAEIGLKLYGKWFQQLILSSIVLSQIGFVGAYIVFTSENLRAFYSSVLGYDPASLNILWFILVQLIIFLPLSLIRDITKLSLSALLANVFILVGLVTIIYFTSYELLVNNHGHPSSSIEYFFNESEFSMFIGVAIFAFEGIGLIIPIEESMIRPKNFPKVLFQVILTISFIFIGIGTLGYLTFGNDVETVIILNLPQDSPMIMVIQVLYAFAILLSTPLQLFPAIRLIESKLFVKTGKTNILVKWEKNFFRFGFVCFTAIVAIFGGKNLDRFVSFVGCFACIPLVYMYPPVLHLKSCCNYNQWGLSEAEKTKRYWLGVLDYFLVVVGGVAMVYTTYQILAG
ncbi:vacuolar amino acid transporter 3 [[Candida] railenensis]|uniref:Vacuolar amino acid transporter 3 n=1 Tax=[Candida] railenensis TaxID=45579 RepID=A0A9P0VZM2_9ASCO|nr:vacuolar amino acid transporter 3 [[Candida] railenensis]